MQGQGWGWGWSLSAKGWFDNIFMICTFVCLFQASSSKKQATCVHVKLVLFIFQAQVLGWSMACFVMEIAPFKPKFKSKTSCSQTALSFRIFVWRTSRVLFHARCSRVAAKLLPPRKLWWCGQADQVLVSVLFVGSFSSIIGISIKWLKTSRKLQNLLSNHIIY